MQASRQNSTDPPPLADDESAAADPVRGHLTWLIARHQGMVWRYLRLLGADPHEADDLMQETFLVVARGADQARQLVAPAAFLRATARNLLLGARRKANRRGPTRQWTAAVDELAAEDPGEFDDARIDTLRRCLSQLRGRGRLAIELHHVEGLTLDQTAERLAIGINGIKSLLVRARGALRACIDERTRRRPS